jgi:hypothetical protein
MLGTAESTITHTVRFNTENDIGINTYFMIRILSILLLRLKFVLKECVTYQTSTFLHHEDEK